MDLDEYLPSPDGSRILGFSAGQAHHPTVRAWNGQVLYQLPDPNAFYAWSDVGDDLCVLHQPQNQAQPTAELEIVGDDGYSLRVGAVSGMAPSNAVTSYVILACSMRTGLVALAERQTLAQDCNCESTTQTTLVLIRVADGKMLWQSDLTTKIATVVASPDAMTMAENFLGAHDSVLIRPLLQSKAETIAGTIVDFSSAGDMALVTGTDAGSRAATWVEDLSTKLVGPHLVGMFAGDVRDPDGSKFMVATRDGSVSGDSGDLSLLGMQLAPTICVRAIKIA